MAIKYNGNTIKTIHFNGETIKELVVNGYVVWKKAGGVITGEYGNWTLTGQPGTNTSTYLHPQQYHITTWDVRIVSSGANRWPMTIKKYRNAAWSIRIPELAGKDYNFEIDLSISSYGNYSVPLRHGVYLQGETGSTLLETTMNAIGVIFMTDRSGYRAMPAQLTAADISLANANYSSFPGTTSPRLTTSTGNSTLRMERRGSTFHFILTRSTGTVLYDLTYTDVAFSNTGDNIIFNLFNESSGARHYDFRLEILT